MHRTTLLIAVLAPLVLLVGCAPAHRLGDIQLENQSVAVTAAIPPMPDVVSGPWPYADRDIRARGEVQRRFDASRAAQMRLDSAAMRVDIAEVLARHALLNSARALGFRPENDPDAANFLLDVRLRGLRFTARSFESLVTVETDAELTLFRMDTEEVVWQRRFRERERVDPALFGAADLGNRLSAREMTYLTSEEMALGIERLTERAADRIAASLENAYRRSR